MAGTEAVSRGATVTVTEVSPGSQLHVGDVGKANSAIGSGAFSEIYACDFNNVEVAVKYAVKTIHQDDLRAEYEILKRLNGANGHAPMALGYGTIKVDHITREALCEELCTGDTIQQVVEYSMRNNEPITAIITAGIGLSISNAVAAIGAHGIRHGDLSYTNIMLDQDSKGAWTSTIIDFGQAVAVSHPGITEERLGTMAFSAAEMFPGTTFSKYKNYASTDMYSIGALMYYMRVWNLFEKKAPNSYFEGYPTQADGAKAIDEFKKNPLDLAGTLQKYGEKVTDDDKELGALIADLTEFNPRMRPDISECMARLERIIGTQPNVFELRQRALIVQRGLRRALSKVFPAARRFIKAILILWAAYLTFAVCQAIYIDYYLPTVQEETEIDEESPLWHIIDDNVRADDQDTYDPDTPGLREHNPSLLNGHLNIMKYGSMTAYYDSDKYITSDGEDFQTGEIAYTDTREALIVPFKDEWDEVAEPIIWGDNLLSMEVGARGGRELISYRYITPHQSADIKTVDEYLESITWLDDKVETTSFAGIDLSYKVGTQSNGASEDQNSYKEVSCYAQRSDTCVLEMRIVLYADEAVLTSVSYQQLLEDLLGTIQIKSTNLDEISASSPYANVVIVSSDSQWQALIKEDEDLKPYVRKGKEWYYHHVSASTAIKYADAFDYDFAPGTDANEWLAQKDRNSSAIIIDKGEIPASDGMTIRWSLADVGYENDGLSLRAWVEIEDSALSIEGIIPSTTDGEEAVEHLLLHTVEISRSHNAPIRVRDRVG